MTAVYEQEGGPKIHRPATGSVRAVLGAAVPEEFLSVVIKFPPSYPMDVQTVELPLHQSVEQVTRYILDVALVSEEKVKKCFSWAQSSPSFP